MRQLSASIVLLGFLLFTPQVSASTEAEREIGIDRSNLTSENEWVQQRALHDIGALHAIWFRDVLSPDTEKFIAELKLVKRNNLKMLVNVLSDEADYDEGHQADNAGEDFRMRCGWYNGSRRISAINLAKFGQRLRTELAAVKDANLTIDAFEIGNEYDLICFNGDAPNGHTPSQEEWMTAVRGYAHFLKAAADVIHDPHYFPDAKIITFGMAHDSDKSDKPPHEHHFSSPARMIAALRDLDGFNYLDNSGYHVDGYGSHIYPDADNLEKSVADTIRADAAILGPDKPFWITEWGLDARKYPNKRGQTRSDGIHDFYAALDQLHLSFGPVFFYCYSPGSKALVDTDGQLLPEAEAVTKPWINGDVPH